MITRCLSEMHSRAKSEARRPMEPHKERGMVRVGLKTRRRGPDAKIERRAHSFSARAPFAAILICSIYISIFLVSPDAAVTVRAIDLPGQNDNGSKPARRLRKGAAIQRSMTRGDLHSYFITLERGQYLRAAVSQHGVDVVMTLFGPGGSNLAVVDRLRMIEGKEIISSIAEMPGDYRLEVRAASKRAAPGTYEIEIEELSEATSEDRSRAAAEKAAEEAAAYVREWWIEESFQAAIKKYKESLALMQLAKDSCGEINLLARIGSLYNRRNQNAKALSYFERAIALKQSTENCQEESDLFAAMGATYAGLGETEKALLYFEQSLALNRAAGDRWKLSQTFHQMGFYYYGSNEPQKALYYFSESLALAISLEDTGMEVGALFGLGLTYWSVGENQKALEAYSKSLPLWNTLGNQEWATTTLDNLGLVYEAMGEHQKALDCYAQTLAFRRTTGQRSAEADTLTGMGRIYIATGKPGKALEHFDEALSIYEEVGNRRGVAYALRSTGDAYALMSEPRKALDDYERALPVDREMGNLGGEVKTLAGLAHAHRDLGNLTEARVRIESALHLIESLRIRLTDEQLQAAYFASKRGYYEFYIDLLMRMHWRKPSEGHYKTALEASERARARGLLDLLAEAGIDIKRGIDPALKRREQDLDARVSQIQSQAIRLRSQTDADRNLIAKLEEELKQAEDERQRLESEIRQKHYKYAEIHYPSPLRVEAIQRMLDEQTALLEYTLGAEGSYLFVVSRDSIHSYRLPQASEINPLVEDVRRALSHPGRRSIGRYVRAARQLYEALIAPAAAVLSDKKRLLIAPDRALYYLPFEILLDDMPRTGGRADYRALPYMVRRWAISYIPSASVLSSLRKKRFVTERGEDLSARKEIVAFGDPVYALKDANQSPDAGRAGQIIRSLFGPEERWDLQRLRDSGREVAGIANSYKPEEVALYLGEQASEENVKASRHLRNARRIHFAAHGFISERRPQHSGLVLTLSEQSKEDGLLQVYEIFDMKLSAELVVLSACRTGLGKEVHGEGVMGLMRAFMYAGASSVVVSQWQVADRSTADLMVKFYKRMNGPLDKTEALRGAKLEMIESDLYSHPYYWAPFVLVGEPN